MHLECLLYVNLAVAIFISVEMMCFTVMQLKKLVISLLVFGSFFTCWFCESQNATPDETGRP